MSEQTKMSRLDAFMARPTRALWVLALPVMAGMAIQTVYMLADMVFVGLLSPEALTALAFNMPLVFLALGIVFGLGSGVTAVIARFIGARDKRGADRTAEHAVAAFQVGARIDQVFVLPVVAVAASLVTLVGMFRGAGRLDLVRGILRCLLIALALGALFFAFAPQAVAVFTDSSSIRSIGTTYLRISVFSYPFIAIAMLTARSLQGLGLGAPVLVLTLMRVILISAPMAYVFTYWFHKPVEWVWISILTGMMVTAAIGLCWLRSALSRLEAAGLKAAAAADSPVAGEQVLGS